MESSLIERQTVEEMCLEYASSVRAICEAHKMYNEAIIKLNNITGDTRFPDWRNLDKELNDIRQRIWAVIAKKTNITQAMSAKRKQEFDDYLWKGQLPEITVINVYQVLEQWQEQIGDYLREAVKEVFDLLTPRGYRTKALKTNSQFKIGSKVIISVLESDDRILGWKPALHSYCSHRVDVMERVFMMLDGKGRSNGGDYYGELHNAIDVEHKEVGETTYFRFKCCRNGNLHLEFKRMDLVEKLNCYAGDGVGLNK